MKMELQINKEQKFHFKSLDAIRTIAFMSTFLAHSFGSDDATLKSSQTYQAVMTVRGFFSFGVPVFFVLSGFLITFLMLKNQESNRFSLKDFYKKRILRIWPVYYAVVIFGFFIFPLIRSWTLGLPTYENASLGMYLAFLSNFDQINNGVLPFGVALGPTWSVSIEEQFYVFWPLLVLLFPKRRFGSSILAVLLISTIVSIIFLLPGTHTVFAMIYLSVGAYFGYLSFYNKWNINEKMTRLNPLWMLFILVLSLLFFWYNFLPKPISVLIFSAGISLFMLFQCYSPRFSLSKIKILENNGKYTYGLYLYHSIAIFIIHTLLRNVLKMDESSSLVLIYIPFLSLLLSYVIARLSYRYFESYFLKLKPK
ncbi:MAG: acyltransferase [Crocinitomicaceae bacterium]|nr:acyltransferase [Crocinitomicaceae bacterium]